MVCSAALHKANLAIFYRTTMGKMKTAAALSSFATASRLLLPALLYLVLL
jgi:hypothetical protein